MQIKNNKKFCQEKHVDEMSLNIEYMDLQYFNSLSACRSQKSKSLHGACKL